MNGEEVKREKLKTKGQTIIEFSFCMIIVFLMAYGLVMIFKWTAQDLIGRGTAHDTQLMANVSANYTISNMAAGPLSQIAPVFYYPTNMRAVAKE